MAQAEHVIWGIYGLWLPRCPVGSWQEFVTRWELALYGRTRSPGLEYQLEPTEFTNSRMLADERWKGQCEPFSAAQRMTINKAIASVMRTRRSHIWACAILPQHVQLVIGHSPLDPRDLAIPLRAEVTRHLQLLKFNRRYLNISAIERQPFWSSVRWRQDLDTDKEIVAAVDYISRLYELEKVDAIESSYVESLPKQLHCREETTGYSVEVEWRMAG